MATDPRAVLRVLDELFWMLRRDGFDLSTGEAIDAARAVDAVGFDRASAVRDALASVIVQRVRDRPRFDAVFAQFLSRPSLEARAPLWQRLAALGFDSADLDILRGLLAHMTGSGAGGAGDLGVLLERRTELDRLLAISGIASTIDAHSAPTLGFMTHRLMTEIGVARARRALQVLQAQLVAAIGERGRALAEALSAELDHAEGEVRSFVRRTFETRVSELERLRDEQRLDVRSFTSLSDAQIDEVRRAVRRFAERLRGAARVRARHALRGRVDPHRTLRRALRTGGAPFEIARKRRRRNRSKLLVLCDVSDSVRAVAHFFLEFTYVAQELFEHARTFVFVSDLRETTHLFEHEPVRAAIDRAWRDGSIIRAGDNSNYGRVLRTFEARHLSELDRATTVVILGDGRTNYHDAAPEVLRRIRARSRSVVWLCPEARGQWASGDSAMARYAAECTSVHEVRCARDLERAARALVQRG